MDHDTEQFIRSDFLAWSGGLDPESEYQITVYVDYARPGYTDPEDVRTFLRDWMERDELEGGVDNGLFYFDLRQRRPR